jgi:predicted ATPase/DNA-binding winged helix-turn-helix (wHTH) protein
MSESPAPAAAPPPAAWRFARFELKPGERQLVADGVPVKLGGRAFDMLVALLERHQRVVSKRELMDVVWPKLVVEENNLQVQVLALRKLLGPAAIATVPGRGYRLTLAVEVVGAAARASPAAPPPVPSPQRTNLTARLPPMVGRAADLAALRVLFREHTLVSIVGAGGIGKTRLAQALVAEIAGDFPDGAWLVELASLADPALVASAVARVAGITLSAERPAVEAVVSVLRSQRMLLALDNCEHLLDGVVDLVDALRRVAPDVRLLVTSQEPLKVVDEQVFRLVTLAVPPAQAEDAGDYSAVQLFVAAAKAAEPRFALTRRNVGAVADICRHLDGIPLALQLAAARVPLLGIEGLRARLDERFHVLTGGARTVLRRHQTLRGALEWSHGLLTAEEQAVFRRLGVFAGGFTLEAAQEVAADATVSHWQVLEHLGALVDKSLVVAEGEDLPRYRLLETTRAFALERLGEAGETDEHLRRHAVTTRDLVRALAKDPWRTTPAAFAALVAEIDNVRAAVAWAVAAPEERLLAIELNVEAFRVWYASALLAEGLAHCLAARPLLDATIPPLVAAKFWLAYAKSGQYSPRADCFEAAQRAAGMFGDLGEASLAYDAYAAVAAIGARRGAVAETDAALAAAERIEDPGWPSRQRAAVRFGRYLWCQMGGRYAQALEYARQQQQLYREDGSVVGEQFAIGNLGFALLALGRPEAALAEVRPAFARLEALNAGAGAGHVIGAEAIALAMLGRHDEARARARVAYARLQHEGDTLWLLEPLASSAAALGRPADAARIAGFVDARYATTGEVRRAPARERRAALDALLDAGLADDERRELLAAGAVMSDDEAFALALGDRS